MLAGRSYNSQQEDDSGHVDSAGIQGNNWFHAGIPELVFYDGATEDLDVLYLVTGADRFVEFKRHDVGSDEFQGKQGTAGYVAYTAASGDDPDYYTYTDLRGTTWTFFGGHANSGDGAWQFWKAVDADGNATYVWDSSDKEAAATSGYDSSGGPNEVYDGSDRRWSYTYSSGRLSEVKVETKTGGTWSSPTGLSTVAEVDYAYYTSDGSNGVTGDLETVTWTTPLSDGPTITKVQYYRYYVDADSDGDDHQVMMVLSPEGTRQYDLLDDTFDVDYESATDAAIKPYASHYFEYNGSGLIDKAIFNGECGCSGGSSGEYEIEYEANPNYSDDSGYDTEWATRTIIERPDGSYVTQYFDEVGQGLDQVVTDGDPDGSPDVWATKVVRDSFGIITKVHTPANSTAYTHTAASAGITSSTSAGLVYVFDRAMSGDYRGYLEDKKYQTGTSGSEYYLETYTYTGATISGTDAETRRAVIASVRKYPQAITSGTTGSTLTQYGYDFYSGTTMPEKITITNPAVTAGNNGSGSSTISYKHYTETGLLDFEKSPSGTISFREYADGRMTKQIRDADTTKTASGEDFDGISIPTGFASSGSPLHVKTTHSHDPQGRRESTTLPGGRVAESYVSKTSDRRIVSLSYPSVVSGTPTTYYGPVGFSVSNLAGRAEASGKIALSGNSSTTAQSSHVDETDDDPITVIDGLGSLCRLSTTIYDETGVVAEKSRHYFDIPASGVGTDGTNYDEITFAFDGMGRRIRTVDPTGTISRQTYDDRGHPLQASIGTDDTGLEGSDMSGTSNMVVTEILEYDNGNDGGSGYLTERTLRVQDSSTDERVTGYDHDIFGRVLLATNPTAPHAFHKFDNLGRRLATGQFSSTASITVGSDDPTTETTNRLALSETDYDEMGRVWKTTRHKIDLDDGSDDDTLTTEHWFDSDSQKVKTDGLSLTKTLYDRLGRVTHTFTLAVDDDSAYADTDDVSGDVVLVEDQTTYDSSDGLVIMRARIDRHHNDLGASKTTGALDSNADSDDLKYTAANLEGRIQITAMWFDSLDRLTDTVSFGTYGGSDFDRDGMSAPARSDTALRTTSSYATDGTVQDVTDPRALVSRTEHDDAGRVTSTIQNYGDGTPSGADSDVTVKYEFTDGLRTKITADLPAGSTDQETFYIYGTTNGTPSASEITTGHLLRAVVYPDSTNNGTTEANINSDDSDVVSFCYNAQGQPVYKKDQSGNVIASNFDDSGRVTQKRVTTCAAGFDNDVLRIATSYDSLGRPETVTQYDNATVGSGTIQDEAAFTFDDWGNLSMFEEDRNSVVSTGNDEYTVSYTFEKSTTGRNTIRRDTMTLPSGAVIDYGYRAQPARLDDDASRATHLKHGAVAVAEYQYNGLGQVVETEYAEPDVMWQKFGSSSGSYPDLDRFNRVTSSRWTKDLATDVDFYDLDITYDRKPNITLVEDNVHSTFDVEYSIDNIDRLTQAEEGTWGGSSITTTSRDEQWTLDQVGNWDVNKLDLNGDGDWGDTDELNDDRTHNDVNELTARDTDDNGTDDYTLSYDAAGCMTDDGESYKYVWDAFLRLREVKDQSDDLVAEHRYNGLGHRIGELIDTDDDGDVDGSDEWRYFAHDERWRIVAHFMGSDSDPIEEYLFHAAGLDGTGGSSYIDLVVLRERDTTDNGTMDERMYFCQNWRADVAAIVDDSGEMYEWAKYSSYGVPFGLPAGDADSDGDCDSADIYQLGVWRSGSYDVRGDLDLDGDVDNDDISDAQNRSQGTTLGRGNLSSIENRNGYAGYVYSPSTGTYSVRFRELHPTLGMWLTRDLLEYSDALDLYCYVGSHPIGFVDFLGLEQCEARIEYTIPLIEVVLEKAAPAAGSLMIPFGPITDILNPEAVCEFEWISDDLNPCVLLRNQCWLEGGFTSFTFQGSLAGTIGMNLGATVTGTVTVGSEITITASVSDSSFTHRKHCSEGGKKGVDCVLDIRTRVSIDASGTVSANLWSDLIKEDDIPCDCIVKSADGMIDGATGGVPGGIGGQVLVEWTDLGETIR